MLAVGDAILRIRAVQQEYEKKSDCRSIEVAAWRKTENPKFFIFFFPFKKLRTGWWKNDIVSCIYFSLNIALVNNNFTSNMRSSFAHISLPSLHWAWWRLITKSISKLYFRTFRYQRHYDKTRSDRSHI